VLRRSAISLSRIQFFGALAFSFFSQALNSLGKAGINTFYQITLVACLHDYFPRQLPLREIRKTPRPAACFVEQRTFLEGDGQLPRDPARLAT
jgi:hypothetical protein